MDGEPIRQHPPRPARLARTSPTEGRHPQGCPASAPCADGTEIHLRHREHRECLAAREGPAGWAALVQRAMLAGTEGTSRSTRSTTSAPSRTIFTVARGDPAGNAGVVGGDNVESRAETAGVGAAAIIANRMRLVA